MASTSRIEVDQRINKHKTKRNQSLAYLSDHQLANIGLSVGKNVRISDQASLYGVDNITIGDNVRIDDFCVLSAVAGRITIGSHIHIGAHSCLFGAGGITMQDFSGLSARVVIYSASDDYGGDYLIGPTMLEEFTKVVKAEVVLEQYTTCGVASVLLPSARMLEGSILGACSLTNQTLQPWKIYAGIPARPVKSRSKGLIKKADEMRAKWKVMDV